MNAEKEMEELEISHTGCRNISVFVKNESFLFLLKKTFFFTRTDFFWRIL